MAGPIPPGDTRQQCWECLRRRWVCDAARPVCNKCRAAGIVCPGYNDQKPLTWLAPGRVTSRTRRQQPGARKNRRKSVADTSDSKASEGVGSRAAGSSAEAGAGRRSSGDKARRVRRPSSAGPSTASHSQDKEIHGGASSTREQRQLRRGTDGAAEERLHQATTTSTGESSDDISEAIQYYNSQIYPSLVSNQLASNPFVVPVSQADNIPASLRHALISMTLSHRIHRMPQNDTSMQGPGPEIHVISPSKSCDGSSTSSSSPDSTARESISDAASGRSSITSASSVVKDASAGRVHRGSGASVVGNAGAHGGDVAGAAAGVGGGVNDAVGEMWRRVHHHMGLSIHALNEEIGTESSRNSDATIISVLVYLIAELQQSISPHWQPHVKGLMALITLRGGLRKLIESASHLKPALLSFTILAVIANTTTPPAEQISASTHLNMVDLISELYSVGTFPSLPCPLPLFVDIININYIRYQVTTDPMVCLNNAVQASSAMALHRIDSFSPESWLQSVNEKTLPNEWLLIARIFQSAVALYAVSTLPWADSLLPLAPTGPDSIPETISRSPPVIRTIHRARLFALLETAVDSMVLQKGMVWPLVVAGVEAASGTKDEQAFVERHLGELSCSTGTSYPLVAKGALERFWASGMIGWHECFDKPYAILA